MDAPKRYTFMPQAGAIEREDGRFILASEHARLMAELEDEIERAYTRGFHDGQKLVDREVFEIVSSPELHEKDARIADLEGAMRVIAETEWLEDEPGGNWKPEDSEAYIEEMEAFCNWAIVFSKAALARATLKGDDNG